MKVTYKKGCFFMNQKEVKEIAKQLHAGCSSIAWDTLDGKHLWGRNYDFNQIAASAVTIIPKNYKYYTAGTPFDHNLELTNISYSKYASVGVGTNAMEVTPVLYEGINEKGLMGGQLFYAGFASFPDETKNHHTPVNPGYVITHILSQCASVAEVIDLITNKITIINQALAGSLATVHWVFSDRTGETIILEPDHQQITIYRHTAGVLTNSPNYSWHKQNLLSYINVRNNEFPDRDMNGIKVQKPFKGTGALGLPGDFTSQSRFIRASFLKYYGIKGKNEDQGIQYLFHFLDNVAMPLGIVKVENQDELSAYNQSIYSACMCAESLNFYWKSYENSTIHCLNLKRELKNQNIKTYPLENRAPEYKLVN